MTEQETRGKIVGIITHEYVTDKDYAYIFDPRIEEKINNMADALIAAGIGDLKEHRIFAGKDGSIKQLYSGEEVEQIVKEREEYKHRAEVAEHELERRLAEATKAMYVYERALYYATLNGETADEVKYNDALKRAQKDFAENKGD